MDPKMFCYQCQETAGCKGCTIRGVCGKSPEVAAMQDLLVYVTRGLSAVTSALRAKGESVSRGVNSLVATNMFHTITNANFDEAAIRERIARTLSVKASLLARLGDTDGLPEAALWSGEDADFAAKAATVGVLACADEDVRSLRELITYGVKGLSAYTAHANALLKYDESVDAFMQVPWRRPWTTRLAWTTSSRSPSSSASTAWMAWRFWTPRTPARTAARR